MNLLDEQSIHLWFIDDESITDKTLLNEYRQWLSAAEKEQYERFANHSKKRQYLVTRALVRSVFSLYAPEINPKYWTFEKNKYGKPFNSHAALPSTLSFNISHSNQAIVLAVGIGSDIGVDVEWIKRSGFTQKFAEHYFAENEVSDLNSLDEANQQNRIFDLWTLKEAYIKAIGLGLRIPLDSVIYHFLDDKKLAVKFKKKDDDLDMWNMYLFNLNQEHRLALAVKSHAYQNSYSVKAFRYTPAKDWKNQDLMLSYSLNKNLVE